MLNFYQLLNYLASFPNSELCKPYFRSLILRGLETKDDVEKDTINENLVQIVKGEIDRRFDDDNSQYYRQFVDRVKSLCDEIAKWAKINK